MILRLYRLRRKQTYLFLASGLIISILYEILSISTLGSRLLMLTAAAIMFMILNIGIYTLYLNKINRNILYYMAAAVLVPLMIFATGAYQSNMVGIILLSIIELGAVCFSWLLISPNIGETRKHRISLIIYTFIILGTAVTDLWNTTKWLLTTIQILPAIYYFILLLILFERVLNMFQSVVRSSVLDGLTGLYNRKAISSRIKQCVEKGECVVVFTDIDNFKLVNDEYGHHKGDQALKIVAEILQEETDNIGYPGRYGGEEIIAVIDDEDVISRIEEWTENFRSRVERESFVTLSIGYSRSRNGVSPEQLLEQADQAMYAAKKSGKNRIIEFNEDVLTGIV
jgi:two-component system cell cycle response regulator